MESMKGKYVIVRGTNSGLFAGILADKEGSEVRLTDCRRLWYWEGACSDFQIALEGVKEAKKCKFTVAVDEIVITDVIEIIPTTETAEKAIRGVGIWKI